MSKPLVIVESPTKAKTIKQFLGNSHNVIASFGHVRDLPKSKIGVDVEKNFEPSYIIPASSRKHVTELKEAAKKAGGDIYLATDEDREGEAIAWHIAHILKLDVKNTKRIVFHEITKQAIERALANPRTLDQHLIDAQQGRRVLDRLVGYELSPLLWKKIRYGLSAGRVQSVALRLIVEREEERTAFKKQEYWTIHTNHTMADSSNPAPFDAQLFERNGKTLKKFELGTENEANAIVGELKGESFTVESVTTKKTTKKPFPPLTTSTLQQAAFSLYGFSAKQTMRLAQKLYEGVDVNSEGSVGLITYMRTDSLHLAPEAIEATRRHLASTYGERYVPKEPNHYRTKSKGAQEAHEAIRPTNPTRTPEDVKSSLSAQEWKLYSLIWTRTVASQMTPAEFNATTIVIATSQHKLKSTGQTLLFDGWLKVSGTAHLKDTLLPELAQNERLLLKSVKPEQHFTQPPARFSEATLVKTLEENGIGRPSTYAPTIATIQDRGYVSKDDDKRLFPEEIGVIVTNLLKKHFPSIIDVNFTAKVEQEFDEIAEGNVEWQPMMKAFYDPFHENIEKKEREITKEEIGKTDKTCLECGKPMVIKFGRFGKFYACSGYPECKHTEQSEEDKKLEDEVAGSPCPECQKGVMALRRGKFGPFLGCSRYPECKHIEKIEKKTGVTCPECGKGEIIEKKSKRGKTFYACNAYPKCTFALWNKPTGEKCPKCSSLLVFAKEKSRRCSNKECHYTKQDHENGEQRDDDKKSTTP